MHNVTLKETKENKNRVTVSIHSLIESMILATMILRRREKTVTAVFTPKKKG